MLTVFLLTMLVLESFVTKMQRLQDTGLIAQTTGNAMLDAVNQSPIAVRARSKQQWLNAFTENATVQGRSFKPEISPN